MKKLFLLSLVTIALTSCEKEDVQPNETTTPTEDCYCGRIVYIGEMEVQWGTNNSPKMDLKVRNNCTDVVETFKVNYSTNIYIGDEWCNPNGFTW